MPYRFANGGGPLLVTRRKRDRAAPEVSASVAAAACVVPSSGMVTTAEEAMEPRTALRDVRPAFPNGGVAGRPRIDGSLSVVRHMAGGSSAVGRS